MVQSCFRKRDISYIFDQCALQMKLFPVLNIFVWKILLSSIVLNKKVVVLTGTFLSPVAVFTYLCLHGQVKRVALKGVTYLLVYWVYE